MIQWQDEAIILSASRYSESSLKLEVLTALHGRYSGIVRGGASSKRIAMFDIGNIVQANWNARLSEQLGSFTVELLAQPAATILHNALALTALNAAVALILQCIPERHAEVELYQQMMQFLKQLHIGHTTFLQDYVALELVLIAATGFPVDLTACAATGKTEDLCYVSPKSGRAVSRKPGKPYADRLLKLPQFLSHSSAADEPEVQDILDALTMTGFFLNHHAEQITHKPLPEARQRLMNLLASR